MATPAETTYPAIIGRIIAGRRKSSGIDQGKAADKAGINRSTWSRLENGDSTPDAVQLAGIANALGTTSADILKDAEDARRLLESHGIKVHMATATTAQSSTSGGFLPLLAAAALGGLVATIINASDEKN